MLKTEVGYTLLDIWSNMAYSLIMLKTDTLAGSLGCVALHQQNVFPVERLAYQKFWKKNTVVLNSHHCLGLTVNASK